MGRPNTPTSILIQIPIIRAEVLVVTVCWCELVMVDLCVEGMAYNVSGGVSNKIKRRGDAGFGMGRWGRNRQENSQKTGSQKVFSDPPGRGVLQISAGGYRRPVHFLPKNAIFSLFCQT